MRTLILGGTVFLGRYVAATALERGHELTLFTRGLHGADRFPQAEHLRGDRGGDLSALAGREWDVVIDTSGLAETVADVWAWLRAGGEDELDDWRSEQRPPPMSARRERELLA